MAYSIDITDKAHDDLNEILSYIAETLCAPMAASNLAESIEECYDILKVNPLIYPLSNMPKLAKKKIRRIPVKNYLIIFKVDEAMDIVHILRVVYGARNYIDLF